LGNVWKLAENGTLTTLHSFAGGSGDGELPNDGVILDKQGNVYGTTPRGGDQTCGNPGCGVVYKLSPTGTETILHFFHPNLVDGFQPVAELALDKSGNLYGTTHTGGNYDEYPCGYTGCGVVFKIDPRSKRETILYGFTGGKDGGDPDTAGVVLDANENVYGTTIFYGKSGCLYTVGCGTVFKITQ